jgi:serine/threonine-protein kinase
MGAAQGRGEGGAILIADRYRVLARVGLGGTAVVYRCVDEHTGRIVAVKVLRTSGPTIPEAAGRFRREARLAARLSHRHIVRVLDFGYSVAPAMARRMPWVTDEDLPVPYLAMEYIFGPTLKDLVRQTGPLPFDWVWLLGEQLCGALEIAHAAGVVHRDVKPQNVMLVDSHIELLAKLTDFGIARQVDGDYTTLTMTGQVLGTPDYLSPEQVLGEPGGPSSDLYALGIVLYELLTARLPFEADTPLAAASRRMVADPPSLTTFRRDVPKALEEVILLVLRRDPAARPASAHDLAAALRWSRARSPAIPPGTPGAWLVEPRRPAVVPSQAGDSANQATVPSKSGNATRKSTRSRRTAPPPPPAAQEEHGATSGAAESPPEAER